MITDQASISFSRDHCALAGLVDGKVKKTVRGGEGKWGQSEVVLVLDDKEAAEHTLEIRVKEEGKKGTITAIGLQ